MYGPTNTGGFNMMTIEDFINASKNKLVMQIYQTYRCHWADLLDNFLDLDNNSRSKLHMYGTENPNINKIIYMTYLVYQTFSIPIRK